MATKMALNQSLRYSILVETRLLINIIRKLTEKIAMN